MKPLIHKVVVSLLLISFSVFLNGQTVKLKIENPFDISESNTQVTSQSSATGDIDITYSQTTLAGNGAPTQEFEASLSIYDCEAADDFVIPAGGSRSIVSVTPIFSSPFGPGGAEVASGPITMRVYNDEAGIPGVLQFTETFNPPHLPTLTSVNCPQLEPGTYWLSLQVDQDFSTDGQLFWSTSSDNVAGPSPNWAWRNPGGGFNRPCIDWGINPACDVAGGGGADSGVGFAFTLNLSPALAGVPTLGQWGIIALLLLLFIIVIAFVKQSQKSKVLLN